MSDCSKKKYIIIGIVISIIITAIVILIYYLTKSKKSGFTSNNKFNMEKEFQDLEKLQNELLKSENV